MHAQPRSSGQRKCNKLATAPPTIQNAKQTVPEQHNRDPGRSSIYAYTYMYVVRMFIGTCGKYQPPVGTWVPYHPCTTRYRHYGYSPLTAIRSHHKRENAIMRSMLAIGSGSGRFENFKCGILVSAVISQWNYIPFVRSLVKFIKSAGTIDR